MLFSEVFVLAVSISSRITYVQAVQGFNYGSTRNNGAIKYQPDFQTQFSTAKTLSGTSGAFGSARLYTTIQAGTANAPISAIPAAIAGGTTLLLGMWASAGQGNIDNEIAALKSAISTYGTAFTSLVTGLSVGSEDLYRITPTGLANDPNSVGASPDTLVNYIRQVRAAVVGTSLSGVPIGHVDTWTAWVNGSNNAVIAACDFVGMNTFPYYQTTDQNPIDNGEALFQEAYSATLGAAQGKPVWITETGWPVNGKTSNLAVASIANAKTYWDKVGCSLFGKTNTYWYTLVDENTDPTQPQFGIVGTTLTSTPLFDLSCAAAPPPASVAPPTTAIPTTSAVPVYSSSPSPQAPSPTMPQAVPSTSPQALPSTSQQAVTSTSQQDLPSTSPQALPSTSPQASPSPSPQALPSTNPQVLSSPTPVPPNTSGASTSTTAPSASAAPTTSSSESTVLSTSTSNTTPISSVLITSPSSAGPSTSPGNPVPATSSSSSSTSTNAAAAAVVNLRGALGVVFGVAIAFF